jgi:hypothetical protein
MKTVFPENTGGSTAIIHIKLRSGSIAASVTSWHYAQGGLAIQWLPLPEKPGCGGEGGQSPRLQRHGTHRRLSSASFPSIPSILVRLKLLLPVPQQCPPPTNNTQVFKATTEAVSKLFHAKTPRCHETENLVFSCHLKTPQLPLIGPHHDVHDMAAYSETPPARP